MPEKKKTTASKRSDKPGADLPGLSASDGFGGPDARVRGGTGAGGRPETQRQFGHFEAAMKLFHTRNLKDARPLFEQASTGPERDVAQRARLHMAMCDRRLQQAAPPMQSAEDYYNCGVVAINARNLPAARENLEAAVRLAPGADHMHYALGLALALSGDVAAAHESLSRAIELEPRNRMIARQDADLAPLAGQPPLDSLLYPEKKSW